LEVRILHGQLLIYAQKPASTRAFLSISMTMPYTLRVVLLCAQRPRDERPGQPSLVSRQTQHPAGRIGRRSPERSGGGSIELLGGTSNEVFDSTRQSCLIMGLAFPNDKDVPSQCSEGSCHSRVAGNVPSDLGSPIGPICLGHPVATLALVAVPEAAVDEDGLLQPR